MGQRIGYPAAFTKVKKISNANDISAGGHAKVQVMRIIWTVLFGALITLLFGAVLVHERGRLPGPRFRRLLTVEEAVRWRPE